MRKLGDVTIFRDEKLYASFPTVAKTKGGDLLVGFRLAPVRSEDGGRTWSEPSPISPEDELGQQDPCLRPLSDGRTLASYFRMRLAGIVVGGQGRDLGGLLRGGPSPRKGEGRTAKGLMQVAESQRAFMAYGYRREPYGVRHIAGTVLSV